MGKHITLGEIHSTDIEIKSGDFIQVSIVWSSGIPKNQSAKIPCRLIFYDGEEYIAAVLFFRDGPNTNERNVCRKLQENLCQYKLINFRVNIVQNENWWVIRGQRKQVVLSARVSDVVALTSQESVIQPFPFQFIELDNVDSCDVGQLVDVLVCTTEVREKRKTAKGDKDCRDVVISSARSKNPNNTGFERFITILGELAVESLAKNKVYAFASVMVDDWNARSGHKSLHTTNNTVIKRIKGLQDLPSKYHQESYVSKLLLINSAVSTPETTRKGGKNLSPGTHCVAKPAVSPNSANGKSVPRTGTTSKLDDNCGYDSDAHSKDGNHTDHSPNSIKNGGRHTLGTLKSYSQVAKMPKPSPTLDFSSDPSLNDVYDFKTNEKRLNVRRNTIPSTKFMDEGEITYRMRSKKRGIALIINNQFFPHRCVKDGQYRQGCHVDVEHLREILHVFKFETIVKENVKSTDLQSILNEFKEQATNEMDACLVAVLSHGVNGLVEMVDGKRVPLSTDIIHQFDGKMFPIFVEKPKIFLIQACKNLPTEEDLQHTVVQTWPRKDLQLENMIVCHSTTPGTTAKRDIILGSHFIYVLVDQLMKHAHDTDFETILTRVQHFLAHSLIWEENHRLHCYWERHSFNKRLFFNPGI